MEFFGKFCFAVTIALLSTLIGGFVFLQLYGWFIASTFHAPVITLPQALGVMLVISYLKIKPVKDSEPFSIEKLGKDFIQVVVIGLLALGIGYLIIQFI